MDYMSPFRGHMLLVMHGGLENLISAEASYWPGSMVGPSLTLQFTLVRGVKGCQVLTTYQ